jgi:hypothetical protein
MSLAAGARFGPYEVTALLGQGVERSGASQSWLEAEN